jgi:hypothetical protein
MNKLDVLLLCSSSAVAVFLLIGRVCAPGFAGSPFKTCTIFTISNGETTLFGNNEDHYDPNPVIQFLPASENGYGSILVGFRHGDGSVLEQGGINEHGLAWDGNGLPAARLNPHPEKPFSWAPDNYLGTILGEARTVEEAIRISRDFDFDCVPPHGQMLHQIHIADASGDAFVISAGPDGEIAYTRKPPGDGYLVSTNFNLANPENGTKSWRYDIATTLLADLMESPSLTADDARDVLREVHLEDPISFTMYSNVFDLKNGTIALNYMAQFD